MNEVFKDALDNEIVFEANDFQFVQKDKKIHDTKFETKTTTFAKDAFKRFCKNKSSVVGAIIIGLLLLGSLALPSLMFFIYKFIQIFVPKVKSLFENLSNVINFCKQKMPNIPITLNHVLTNKNLDYFRFFLIKFINLIFTKVKFWTLFYNNRI